MPKSPVSNSSLSPSNGFFTWLYLKGDVFGELRQRNHQRAIHRPGVIAGDYSTSVAGRIEVYAVIAIIHIFQNKIHIRKNAVVSLSRAASDIIYPDVGMVAAGKPHELQIPLCMVSAKSEAFPEPPPSLPNSPIMTGFP